MYPCLDRTDPLVVIQGGRREELFASYSSAHERPRNIATRLELPSRAAVANKGRRTTEIRPHHSPLTLLWKTNRFREADARPPNERNRCDGKQLRADDYPPMYDISTFGIGMFDSVRCSE